MSFRPRHLFLPFAAVVISLLCAWKMTRTYEDPQFAASDVVLGPAPLFVERNEDLIPIKLSAYIGRHRIIVAFFDGRLGADRSPLLLRLRDEYDELKRRGWVVLAIGDTDPITNRAAGRRAGGFPFEVLADVDGRSVPDYDTLVAWGRFDPETSKARPGLVLVDRTGHVRYRNGVPVAEADPDAALDAILAQ